MKNYRVVSPLVLSFISKKERSISIYLTTQHSLCNLELVIFPLKPPLILLVILSKFA